MLPGCFCSQKPSTLGVILHLPQAEGLLTDHGRQAIKPKVILLGCDTFDWGLHVNTTLG